MHYGRIIVVVGALIGAIGLIPPSASSDAEQYLEPLSQAVDGIPAGFDSTYTALYNDTSWAAIIYVVAILAAFATAAIPPFDQPMKRLMGLSASVIGVLMLAISVFATMGAADDASDLEAALGQLAAAGQVPAEVTGVSIGWGWYAMIIGGVIVAIGGVLSLIARPDDDALADA